MPSAFYQIFLKYIKGFCLNKFQNIFEQFLTKYQWRFKKDFSAQHSLLSILNKQKSVANNGKVIGALLTDLSKEFDCLSHDLLTAKLNAYGISMTALTKLLFKSEAKN